MHSIDILHTVNTVAITTASLRFCDTLSLLDAACRSIRADLELIRPCISHELFVVLDTELRNANSSQVRKIIGVE